MKNNTAIKKIAAAFLLLLFVFGSTPKKFLHNIVANHKDTFAFSLFGEDALQKNQFAKATINCHCDNTVIESPFVEDSRQSGTGETVVYISFLYRHCATYSLPHHSYFKLRGPPDFDMPAV